RAAVRFTGDRREVVATRLALRFRARHAGARACARHSRRGGRRGAPGDPRPRGRLPPSRRFSLAEWSPIRMIRRLLALFRKEVLDLMRNRAALVPVVVAAAFALAMPFSITI